MQQNLACKHLLLEGSLKMQEIMEKVHNKHTISRKFIPNNKANLTDEPGTGLRRIKVHGRGAMETHPSDTPSCGEVPLTFDGPHRQSKHVPWGKIEPLPRHCGFCRRHSSNRSRNESTKKDHSDGKYSDVPKIRTENNIKMPETTGLQKKAVFKPKLTKNIPSLLRSEMNYFYTEQTLGEM